jgi:bile acid:Na+ symporter, BASS family
MNFSAILPMLLLLALALVMFGLGISLSLDDFCRLREHPGSVCLALILQVLVLPSLAYVLIIFFSVEPVFAVGLMLLAASPGGVSANLFSHLFGGNVAMNISLTAINTMLSIVSLPLIANWAISTFVQSGQVIPLQYGKVFEVVGVILLPVLLGMVVRVKQPNFSVLMGRPMKLFSVLVLVMFALLAIVKEWDALKVSFMSLGPLVLVFNLFSLMLGYYISRWVGVSKSIATAISFEIGIHNSTLAIYVALSVLNNLQLALPAALYSVSMYLTALLFGMLVISRKTRREKTSK